MPTDPDSYRWLSRGVLGVAGCITVVPGADRAKVASVDEAPLVVEENGFQGSRSEVLRPASKASTTGLAVSVFWNVNGLVMVSAARRGSWRAPPS